MDTRGSRVATRSSAPTSCLPVRWRQVLRELARMLRDQDRMRGLCFICNTPFASTASSVLNPPVESATQSGRT